MWLTISYDMHTSPKANIVDGQYEGHWPSYYVKICLLRHNRFPITNAGRLELQIPAIGQIDDQTSAAIEK